MAATFLELTNEVLRAYNQVELTSSNFDLSRGIHSWAKDGVNMAIRQINTRGFKWPFSAMTGSQVMTIGVSEYSWPADFKSVDWDSFYIEKNTLLSVNSKTLIPIDKEEWVQRYRDVDLDNTTDGITVPKYVFPGHGTKFGVSPVPDAAYTVKFKYYKVSTPLVAYGDQTDIPDQFRHVIVLGASKHFARMMDGLPYSENLDDKEFIKEIMYMRTILINDEMYIRETRVNF